MFDTKNRYLSSKEFRIKKGEFLAYDCVKKAENRVKTRMDTDLQ